MMQCLISMLLYEGEDSKFLNFLEHGEHVMAGCGFKIHNTFAFDQCSLTISASKHTNLRMLKSDVIKTSRIANLRIYVEQAIKI